MENNNDENIDANKMEITESILEREKQNEEENIGEQLKKPVNKKMAIFNFVLIIVIFIGLFIYMVNVDGLENIRELLNNVDYKWVFAGIGCLLLYWICDILTLHIPIKRMYKTQPITNSIKVAMLGQLFNNITPFASGGQPIQAYELTKTGKRVSDSLSAMAIKFIVTQTALVISTLTVVILEFNFFKELMQEYLWVAVIGFLVNIIAIILVILAGIKKRIITIITTPIIKLLGKLKIIKDSDYTVDKLDKSIDNFGEQFKIVRSEKVMVLKMFIIAVIQSFSYYSMTYMVYRAFGNSGISFLQIIPAQAFLLLIMTFIPTPGSGLGAEGGFYLLFNSVFKEGTINMSILFWRMYTFYLPILVGSLFLIPTRGKITKKNND